MTTKYYIVLCVKECSGYNVIAKETITHYIKEHKIAQIKRSGYTWNNTAKRFEKGNRYIKIIKQK